MKKVCSKCKKSKEDEFRFHKTSGRHLSFCKECEILKRIQLKQLKHLKTKSDFIGKK